MINILSPPKTLTQRASKAFPPVCVKFLLPWASFFLTADCMSCHFYFKFPPLLLWTVDCRLTVSTLHMCTSAYYEKSITIVLHLEAWILHNTSFLLWGGLQLSIKSITNIFKRYYLETTSFKLSHRNIELW